MSKKNSYITVTDQFCGAGGSSQGAHAAGVEVKLAMNHWKLAIETHNTNFPDTLHDCTDISACDPRRYPSTDILITSPECTTHSPAGGNTHKRLKKQMDLFNTGKIDPATERSRATMWDVCRFAEYHNYNAIITENVLEVVTEWALFDVWLLAMHKLGYNHRICCLNSMHFHPTPQSRDRVYIVFWKKGNKAPELDYMPAAWCPTCEKNVASVQTWKKHNVRHGKYRRQYVYCCPACTAIIEPYYYAAFNCIDWTDLGERIGDRKKPLVENTMARIRYGLDKYGCRPLVVTTRYSSGMDCRIRTTEQALPTQPGDSSHGILSPFFIRQDHTHAQDGGKVKGADEPYQTQTTSMASGFVVPYIVRNQTPGNCKPATGAIGAITCQDTHALLTPFVPIARGKSKASSATDPLTTQSCMINHGVCTPPLIVEQYGTGKARPIERELNTITASGNHSGLLTSQSWNSFLSSYYGSNNQNSHISDAVPTVTTKDRQEIVNYRTPAIEDCYYRMLKANEVQAAMAFALDYIILGSTKDKVKQCGNAVTPPVMQWLVQQVKQSLL